jgi:hypothetical protein
MYGYNYHRPNRSLRTTAALFILSGLIPLRVHAQESPGGTETDRRFAEMTALIQKLQARVDDLEGKLQSSGRVALREAPTFFEERA